MSSTESNNDCNICTDPFNRSSRAAITCAKCEFVCCKTCFKRYITDTESPHVLSCMSCGVKFDRSSLYDRLGRAFMSTTFRDIREMELYEIEKGFFAATQDIIEAQLEVERLRRTRADLDDKYDKIKKDRTKDLMDFRYRTDQLPIAEALDEYLSLQEKVEVVDDQLQDERRSLSEQIDKLQSNGKKTTKRTYVLQCPATDCKGMLSNENKTKEGNYVCSICETVTCVECKMTTDASQPHTCDPGILESVKMLEESSKPCPACGVPIYKISGCHQMFCTKCHASFDWRTLKINNGTVHNPHHAEWLRSQRNRPRELQDIQCGREIDIDNALRCIGHMETAVLAKRRELSKEKVREYGRIVNYIFESLRVAIHHNHVTIVSLGRDRYSHQTNQDLRVNLLLKRLPEEEFRRQIQKNDKANSKRNELLQIVLTYRDAITDLAWPFIIDGRDKTLDEWEQLYRDIRALEVYIDGCFGTIANVYGSVCHSIMSDRAIR